MIYNPAMTRSELIAKLAARFPNLTYSDGVFCIKTITAAMSDHLASGGRIEVRGFGSFSINIRPPRLGRNPKTGERVSVPAKPAVHFKAGVEMRERVNNVRPQMRKLAA